MTVKLGLHGIQYDKTKYYLINLVGPSIQTAILRMYNLTPKHATIYGKKVAGFINGLACNPVVKFMVHYKYFLEFCEDEPALVAKFVQGIVAISW